MSELAARFDGARDRLRDEAQDDDKLLDVDEAAEILGLSAYTVRQWAREGTLPALHLGRYWRFRKSSLLAWIAERERGGR